MSLKAPEMLWVGGKSDDFRETTYTNAHLMFPKKPFYAPGLIECNGAGTNTSESQTCLRNSSRLKSLVVKSKQI